MPGGTHAVLPVTTPADIPAFRVLPVTGARELTEFIHLPEQLPGRRANWVPPIWSDEHAWHDPKRNAQLEGCELVRYIARSATGVALGRITGIIHHRYNALKNERTARYFHLDAVDDEQVTHALLHAVEQWARSRGAVELIGPFGLSDKDPQGLQVEGFQHLPVIATATNPAYLPNHVEQAGYVKHTDCVVYRLPIPEQLPEAYDRIAVRATGRSGLRILRFSSRWQLRRWIIPVLRLVNEAYQHLLGFMPMGEREMRALANTYLPLLDPRFTVIVVDQEQRPAAFVVAVPDMSEGIRKAGGRLLPFGWFHVLRAMRKSRQLDLLLGAVRPDLQGRGLTSILGTVLLREAHARGFTHIDSHLVLEDNHRMRAELERLGAGVYKRYRIFRKPL